jgi:PST family polysaccharide transporter
VTDVSFPAITSLQNDHARMNEFTYKWMQSNALLSFAVFAGIAAVASDLVPVLFGDKWPTAAGLCSLLSLYALVGGLHIFFRPLLLAAQGMRQWIVLNAFQSIGVLVACLVGVRFGVPYLVLGLILNSLLLTIPILRFLHRRIDLSPTKYFRPCLIPAVAALFMVGSIWGLSIFLPRDLTPLFRLICKVIVGGTTYLGFVWLLLPDALRNLVTVSREAIRVPRKIPIVPPLI